MREKINIKMGMFALIIAGFWIAAGMALFDFLTGVIAALCLKAFTYFYM